MKRLLFYMMIGTLSVIMASCESKPKFLTDNLVVYTKESAEEHVLYGVKEANSNKIIVKANRFSKITIDDNLIFATIDEPHNILLYTAQGNLLGDFEMVNHWQQNGDYYLGVKYGWSFYYFPKQQESVWTNATVQGITAVVLQTTEGIEVRDCYGKLLFLAPLNAVIIKESPVKDNNEFFFVIKETEDYCLYNQYGIKLQAMTLEQFNKMKQSLQEKPQTQTNELPVWVGKNIANA